MALLLRSPHFGVRLRRAMSDHIYIRDDIDEQIGTSVPSSMETKAGPGTTWFQDPANQVWARAGGSVAYQRVMRCQAYVIGVLVVILLGLLAITVCAWRRHRHDIIALYAKEEAKKSD